MDQHISQIYASNLLPMREGYPLWIPEPDADLPVTYQQSGVRNGDVGVISQDGGFQFLFNICSSADDPVNEGGVPPNFERIDGGLTRYRPSYFSRTGTLVQSAEFARKSISIGVGADAAAVPVGVEFGVEFFVEKDQGAILALPQGGSRRDAQQLQVYETQIRRHGRGWYTYVRDVRGWRIDNGDLYLVTGTDKVPTWGALAFRNRQRSCGVSFQFTATPMANAGLHHQYQWRYLTGQSARQGPEASALLYDANGAPAENQCVFLRGYKIMISPKFHLFKSPVELINYTGPRNFQETISPKADVTPSSVPSTSTLNKGKASQGRVDDINADRTDGPRGSVDDVEGDALGQFIFPPSTSRHPCDELNKYLLDNTDCSIAFTHDDVWMSAPAHVDVVCDLVDQGVLAQYDFETVGTDAVTLRRRTHIEDMTLEQDGMADVIMSEVETVPDKSTARASLTDLGPAVEETIPSLRDPGYHLGSWLPYTPDVSLPALGVSIPPDSQGVSPPLFAPTFTAEDSTSPATQPKFAGTSFSMEAEQSTPGDDSVQQASSRGSRKISLGADDPGALKERRATKAAHRVVSRSSTRQLCCHWPSCSATFTRQRNLQEHMKLHENKRAYACPVVGCGRRFNTRGLLRSHRRHVHEEEEGRAGLA